ncbi:MAG TPA: hypothetical protein VEK08_19415 [Planctomycetota bacterium]|nr:hypothetical protein [Planctomycetota bacterium]
MMALIQDIIARLSLLIEGSWDLLSARLTVTQWTFAPGGAVLICAGCAAALMLALICYRRTTEGLTLRSRVALASLRFIAVLALLIMVSGVACAVDVARTQLPSLLVVVDDSPSMNLPDLGGTRLEHAHEALFKRGLLEKLRSSYLIRVAHTSGIDDATAESRKALPQSLARELVRAASAPGLPPAHILLISDGVQLGSDSLANAAAEIASPVSTLTAGDSTSTRDVYVDSVNVPQFVYQHDRAQISAQIRSLGMEGEAAVQLVHVNGTVEKEIATSKVTLRPGSEPSMVRVEFNTPAAGLQRYTLRLLPVNGELTALNNSVSFNLDVREEKIRVLFIEGEPSWEYKFVKQALEADPVVEFYGLVRLPGDEWFYQGKSTRPDGKPVLRSVKAGFADTLDELNFFDVLILGDLERKHFEQANRFELLEAFVRQHGGGLITIGGMKVYSAGNYEGTPLARLLPLDVSREKKTQLINRFNVQVTTQGILHPATQLEFDPVKNEEAWAKLPWVEGGNAFRVARPGATTLLLHPTLKTPLGPRPVAAAWQTGAGRVLSSALDGTWHWRLARTTETDYHQRYWSQSVRWLAGDPRTRKSRNVLMSDDPILETGKPATFSILLKDKDGNAQTDAIAEFTIESPGGETILARSSSDPAIPGRYSAALTPRIPGPHRIRLSIQRTGEEARQQERTFEVGSSRAEYLQIVPDVKALSTLASATGGTSASLSQFEALHLPTEKPQIRIQRHYINVWQAPGLFILLVLCLGTEWLLRKRRGLA